MGILHKLQTLRQTNWGQLKENLFYLASVDLRTHEFEQTYRIKDEVLDEAAAELDEYRRQRIDLQILDGEQTLNMLLQYPKSFSRFGDGEIHIMEGKDQPFQNYDPELAKKMETLLSQHREDIYIGLNRSYFISPLNFSEHNRKFYRVNGTGYRRFFTSRCDRDAIYLDASCFGAYYRYDDSFDFEAHYSRIKSLFAGKKIAILSGEGVIEKLSFDVFEQAADKMIIHGPRTNAFSEYDSILKTIDEKVPRDYIICLILGQTATAMVWDLTDMGYVAWDVGHVAKDYDAYMKKTEKTEKNINDFWAPD